MYIHLTTHSAYSLQRGLMTPTDLAQAAQSDGMPAIGLTDHNLLTGAIEFVTACKRVGIQPILGLEIDLNHNPLYLLATSLQGWSNLCRLSSALALRDNPDEPCTLEILAAYSEDLIALSGDPKSLKEIFLDRLYIALYNPSKAAILTDLARKFALPTVVTHPIYFFNPEQVILQRTLSAIGLNKTINTLPDNAVAPPNAYIMSSQEMETRFKEFPEALNATVEIAERCNFELPIGKSQMPTVPLPVGVTAAQHLRNKATEGAKQLYGEITPVIQTRLEHELGVIARMGFEPIFLIVEDIINYARQTGVPFSSRGSAASSLVAHCLGITSPDPLRLNLYFERFLNPARTTPPDIDTDLCSRRRDSVIQHVFDTYGRERVAMIGTINRFRLRSALREVAKAHGLESAKVRELANQMPHAFWARFEESEEGKDPPSSFAELRAAYPSHQYQIIFDEAEAILKLPRHLSVHPGGVIVAPGALTDLVPVMRSGSKGIIITQLDLESVELLGLVKIDLLGIRGLTVLGDVAEFVHESHPEQFQGPLAVLDSTPADDPGTAQRIEQGETIGCFQIESPGMRATLREIHARSEDDIMAALALYRPGPLSGGLKDAFVRRFRGEEKVKHLHPSLAPLLDETFGVILYQEQVLRIAHELAGFSLAEADLLRRAMSHFDPGKRMRELQRKFVREAQEKSGVPAETGERIWEMMAAFAGYGFPKAHAASYARVAWRSAWCKSHFPAEFMAAVLANWGGYYSQRVYLSEARRMGLIVRPPHVNYAVHNFSVRKLESSGERALFMGLDQVKELTRQTIGRIIRFAPFASLEDFLTRAAPRAQEAENLARVGALDGLGKIPSILKRLQNGGWQQNQLSLFEWTDSGDEDWTLQQKVNAQLEILAVSLDAHPLELVAEKVAEAGAISTLEAVERIGRKVTVAGVRQTSHRSRTAKGDLMLFLTLEDLHGTLDAILFPEVYRSAKPLFDSTRPILITGMMEMDTERGEPLLRAEKVVSVE
ncbi:MAG: DNA polymerase III subunit alpha [Anaerolineaceae bacterium]|nr:MAG: DNA polymerase III subunit alpha [Anaerolineaceae bacterium]